MENFSPSRIQPLAPGEEKTPDDPRPRKQQHSKTAPAVTPATEIPELDAEPNDLPKHKLDERA